MIPFLKRLDVRVSVTYGVIAMLWILFSDSLMAMLFGRNPSLLATISVIKGQAFVVVTTLALFFVLSIELRKRKRAETDLQKNKIQHGLIVDNMIEGAQIIGYDWTYIYLNDAAVRQSQKTREELIGSTMMDRYPGIEDTEMFSVLQDCMKNRIAKRIENKFVYPDESSGWFELSIEPVPEGIFILSLDISDRKQSELLLTESEQKLRLFIENAPSAIAMFDHEMTYLLVSRRWLTAYRLEEEDVIGRSHYEVFPDLPEAWKEIHQRCLNGAIEKSDGDLFPRSDGTIDWVRWEIHPWHHNNGNIGGIILFSEVITDRIEAEQALNLYAQRIQLLHEIDTQLLSGESLDKLLHSTLKHIRQIIPCQRSAVTMFDPAMEEAVVFVRDYTPPFTLGKDARNRLPSDWVAEFGSAQSRILHDLREIPNPRPVYQRLLELGLRSSIQVLLLTNGKPIGMLSLNATEPNFFTPDHEEILIAVANQLSIAVQQMTLKEATQQHVEQLQQAQSELEKSENRYRRVVEDQIDVICRYDPDFKLTFVNQQYADLYGKTPEEMVGMNILDIVSPEIEQDIVANISKLSPTNTVVIHENPLAVMDGNKRWFQWTRRALIDETGTITEYQAVGRDITDLKTLQVEQKQQIQLVEAMRDSLATLTTTTDVKTALQEILNSSAKIIPSEAGTIILFEDETVGRIVGSRGYSETAQQYFKDNLIPLKAGNYHQADDYYVVSDTRTETDWKPFPYTEWVRSSIGVALKVKGESLGLLIADGSKPDQFNDDDLENLQAFARYASLALEAADYVDNLEQRVQERTVALQASKDHAEAILNNSPDGIALIDPDFRIEQTNDSFHRIFQTDQDSDLNTSLVAYIHPDDVEKFTHILKTILNDNTNKRKQTDIRAMRQDGSIIDIEISIGLVKDNGLVCVVRDVTDRKKQQRQLRYHANLQENVTDAVIVTDMESKVQSWNRAAERIYGWSADEAIGQLVNNFLNTNMNPGELEQSLIDLNEKGWWYGEVVQHHKDGTPIHILASVTLIMDDDGVPVSMIAINHDITERKHAEEELNIRIAEELEFQAHLKALHDITIELTQISELDLFFQRAIELGLKELNFDRLAIFLYEESTGMAQGTYGTDKHGQPISEAHLYFEPEPDGTMMQALQRIERFYFHDNRKLYNDLQTVGYGWNATAVLWNGKDSIGWLVADNLISQDPPSQPQLDTLGLYAMSIGTLLAQKQVQLALQASEKRYRLLAENILDLVILTNLSDELLFVSPSSLTVMGYEPDELLGQQSLDFVHPEDQHIVVDTLTEMIKSTDTKFSVLVRVQHKQGYYIWLETDGRPVRSDKTGKLEGFISSSRDVSDRIRVEQALRDSEEQFRLLVEAAPIAIVITNARGHIKLVNDQAEQLFAYDRHALIDRPVEQLIPAPLRDQHINHRADYIHDPIMRPMGAGLELMALRQDGTQFPVEVELSYVETGNDTLVMSFVADITERKKAEQALIDSLAKEKELGELKTRFVSMASHEFRTPLATILALTETVSNYRHKLTDDQIDERLERIKAQIDHLKSIMEDVLLLGRMQSRRVTLNRTSVDLDSLCRSVIDEFMNRDDILQELIYSCQLPINEVEVDRKLIRQIVNNLVSNAIKYSPPSKPVFITLDYDEPDIIIKIEDKGIGIPESDLKHLFEPFHRASNVGTISGTGLGLVITKESVDLHDGTIDVTSEVNKGTTFAIRIPTTKKEGSTTNDQDFSD